MVNVGRVEEGVKRGAGRELRGPDDPLHIALRDRTRPAPRRPPVSDPSAYPYDTHLDTLHGALEIV